MDAVLPFQLINIGAHVFIALAEHRRKIGTAPPGKERPLCGRYFVEMGQFFFISAHELGQFFRRELFLVFFLIVCHSDSSFLPILSAQRGASSGKSGMPPLWVHT